MTPWQRFRRVCATIECGVYSDPSLRDLVHEVLVGAAESAMESDEISPVVIQVETLASAVEVG